MDWIETCVRVVKVLSIVALASVELGFVDNRHPNTLVVRIALFLVLTVSVVGEETVHLVQRIRKHRGLAASVMTTALDLACERLAKGSSHTFRANLMRAQGVFRKRLIIRYHSSNMEGAPDVSLAWEKWQGCVGHAWGNDAVVVADMTFPDEIGRATWGLTPAQRDRTQEVKAILSAPVRAAGENGKTIGFVNFDSKDPCAQYLMEENARNVIKAESRSIAALLQQLGHT